MAMVDADWKVTRATKKIAYIGGDHSAAPTYATVIQLHRWLQALLDDDVASGDDQLDISTLDTSRRSTDNIITLINGYTLDETAGTPASEHLYDGSVIEDSGNRIFDGVVNFGNSDVQIQIIQDGAVLSDDWWNYNSAGLNPDSNAGISHRWMLKVREDAVDIDGRRLIGTCRQLTDTTGRTFSEFKINGTSRGNNVLALTDTDDINNNKTATTLSGYTGITNTEGLRLIDVDNNGTDEEYFSEWNTNQPTRSINDFYERMKWLTRDGSGSTINGLNGELFRGITHSFAYDGETGGAPTTNDEFAWGTNVIFSSGSGTFQVGEAVHEDTATPTWTGRILAIDDNTGTGSLIIDVGSDTVTGAETFTCQTSGATGTVNGTPTAVVGGGIIRFFAIDDDGVIGNLYGQLMKGTSPSNDTRFYDDVDVAKYLDVNGTVTEQAIATPFCGASTGSAIIGAYGVGLEYADLTDSDKLKDLSGTTNTPPNNVTNTVGGLTFAGDVDRVFVLPWDGISYDINGDADIDKGQFLLSAALTTDNITSVIVKTGTEIPIPSDTPATGYIRVIDNLGYERRLHYSDWDDATDTFTIDTIDGNEDFSGNEAAVNNEVYIAYLDQDADAATVSYTGVYSSDRDLVALVRNGGSAPIKQFISEWSFKSTNQTLNAIRTTDV